MSNISVRYMRKVARSYRGGPIQLMYLVVMNLKKEEGCIRSRLLIFVRVFTHYDLR